MEGNEKMRGIAAGIFIATSAIAAIYFFSSPMNAGEQTNAMTEDDAHQFLEDSHVILTNDEYEQLSSELTAVKADNEELIARLDETSKLDEELKQGENNEQQSDEEVIYQTIISIQQGMTSTDIGRHLEKMNIIDNRRDFERKIADMGVETKIQLGETEISSDMSLEEIIRRITS
ncbi:hypothetical protein LGQ02_07260 [Bacillus shivajii]|uniref:hypothetical protein n=1 Tax=Bacillus shivajii TaxID=1983719 RepID=UPI001CFC03D4|nr:hypothetical protein [Bacillus shivajii]UCZ54547.1 hypothetical protein LGQ02_07260 [Bacillus shivajii]